MEKVERMLNGESLDRYFHLVCNEKTYSDYNPYYEG